MPIQWAIKISSNLNWIALVCCMYTRIWGLRGEQTLEIHKWNDSSGIVDRVQECKGSQRQIQRELIVNRTWTCSIWASWIATFSGHILRTNTNKKDRHISEALKLFRKPLIIYMIMKPISQSSSQTFQKYGHSMEPRLPYLVKTLITLLNLWCKKVFIYPSSIENRKDLKPRHVASIHHMAISSKRAYI